MVLMRWSSVRPWRKVASHWCCRELELLRGQLVDGISVAFIEKGVEI